MKASILLRKMIGLAVNGITSFSVVPLRMIAALGLLICFLSVLMIGWGNLRGRCAPGRRARLGLVRHSHLPARRCATVQHRHNRRVRRQDLSGNQTAPALLHTGAGVTGLNMLDRENAVALAKFVVVGGINTAFAYLVSPPLCWLARFVARQPPGACPRHPLQLHVSGQIRLWQDRYPQLHPLRCQLGGGLYRADLRHLSI